MTLREFVDHGTIGERRTREAFETGMLEGAAWCADNGMSPHAAYAADLDERLWEEFFAFWIHWIRQIMETRHE